MRTYHLYLVLLFSIFCTDSKGLKPEEILVVYNKNNPVSENIACYYAQKRKVGFNNVLPVDVKNDILISRREYEKQIALPVRSRLEEFNPNENLRCILLIYGVPVKIRAKIPDENERKLANHLRIQADEYVSDIQNILSKLHALQNPHPVPYKKNNEYSRKEIIKHAKEKVDKVKSSINNLKNISIKTTYQSAFDKYYKQLYNKNGLIINLIRLNRQIDSISGKQTDASVDSEISMVKYSDYELYRWQPNRLKGAGFNIDFSTMMVSRLDGPDQDKILKMIDKSIKAEKVGLKGVAYFDSRGFKANSQFGSFGYFDQAIRDAADLTRSKDFKTIEERTSKLFAPQECPDTALYCGWYSLKKYIPSFKFNDGAIGYHIASWEAVNIRDVNSTQWCASMLNAGITVTLGAVSEPYLQAFPEPDIFFNEIFKGYTVVEAYYKTKPYNSWQMILLADPLYSPYKNKKLQKPDLF